VLYHQANALVCCGGIPCCWLVGMRGALCERPFMSTTHRFAMQTVRGSCVPSAGHTTVFTAATDSASHVPCRWVACSYTDAQSQVTLACCGVKQVGRAYRPYDCMTGEESQAEGMQCRLRHDQADALLCGGSTKLRPGSASSLSACPAHGTCNQNAHVISN
jgi:hypothetical protein